MTDVDIPSAITRVTNRIAPAYAAVTTRFDIHQHLTAHTLEPSFKLSDRADAGFRLVRQLFGEARRFCEQQHEQALGWRTDDQYYYDRQKVADLLPLAMDPAFDGSPEKTGDDLMVTGGGDPDTDGLLALVLDVRIAIRKAEAGYALRSPVGSDEWLEGLTRVVSALGGPAPDRRRAQSNASARAATTVEYAGVNHG